MSNRRGAPRDGPAPRSGDVGVPGSLPLSGLTVVVGREDPGQLGELLATEGATTMHVPLIVTAEPDDGGVALQTELDRLTEYDWLVVTSVHGADRVGRAAAEAPGVLLAVVGTTTAARLERVAGRPVDLVPGTQTARALAAELTARATGAERVLVAAADRSDGQLATGLRAGGMDVTAVTAYRTVLTPPAAATVERILAEADAVLLTSGSTALSWGDAVGSADFEGPIVAIGPSTAAVAARVGIPIAAVAGEHSLEGLVQALADVVSGAV